MYIYCYTKVYLNLQLIKILIILLNEKKNVSLIIYYRDVEKMADYILPLCDSINEKKAR
jgi:hypothetical protein